MSRFREFPTYLRRLGQALLRDPTFHGSCPKLLGRAALDPTYGIALVALMIVLAAPPVFAQKLGLGREATPQEVAAWNIDVRPDGQGLPKGRGTAKLGEEIFQSQCASCHGEFGEGRDRWPALSGGHGTLKDDRPDRTVGSYWPYASTVFDYIRRAMPFGNAQSLNPDELYAVTAYVLHITDVIKDTGFELNQDTLASVKMPNAAGFYDDDREKSEKAFWRKAPCMKDCKAAPQIRNRATDLAVTPEASKGPKVD
jgi:S-disulfanyl-L-cysteine oxidoreductase SoxD